MNIPHSLRVIVLFVLNVRLITLIIPTVLDFHQLGIDFFEVKVSTCHRIVTFQDILLVQEVYSLVVVVIKTCHIFIN